MLLFGIIFAAVQATLRLHVTDDEGCDTFPSIFTKSGFSLSPCGMRIEGSNDIPTYQNIMECSQINDPGFLRAWEETQEYMRVAQADRGHVFDWTCDQNGNSVFVLDETDSHPMSTTLKMVRILIQRFDFVNVIPPHMPDNEFFYGSKVLFFFFFFCNVVVVNGL